MTTARSFPVVMVTGARTFTDRDAVYAALEDAVATYARFAVRHGDCPKGADRIARDWCEHNGYPEDRMPADWDQYGKQAGFIRNQAMVDRAPRPLVCLGFVDLCQKEHCWPNPHPTHGTAHAMSCAELAKIPVIRYHHERTS